MPNLYHKHLFRKKEKKFLLRCFQKCGANTWYCVNDDGSVELGPKPKHYQDCENLPGVKDNVYGVSNDEMIADFDSRSEEFRQKRRMSIDLKKKIDELEARNLTLREFEVGFQIANEQMKKSQRSAKILKGQLNDSNRRVRVLENRIRYLELYYDLLNTSSK